MDKDEILSLNELSAYLKLSKSTVYYMCRTGKIPASKLGKQLRFRKSAIDKWMESLERERRKKNKPNG